MTVDMDEYGPFATGAGSQVGEPQWGRIYESLVTSGVTPRVLGQFKVTQRGWPASGLQNMSVDVAPGQAFLMGHQGRMAGVTNLPIAANSSGVVRYDRIIAWADRTADKTYLDVLQGSAGAPAVLVQNELIWQSHIAMVTVPSGAASITNAAIVNKPDWAVSRTAAPMALHTFGNLTTIPSGIQTVMDGSGTPFVDTGGYWDPAHPSRFTAPKDGIYFVGGQLQVDESNRLAVLNGFPGAVLNTNIGKGARSLTFAVEGGTNIYTPQHWWIPAASVASGVLAAPEMSLTPTSGPFPLLAGQWIEMSFFQLSGMNMVTNIGAMYIVDWGAFA